MLFMGDINYKVLLKSNYHYSDVEAEYSKLTFPYNDSFLIKFSLIDYILIT